MTQMFNSVIITNNSRTYRYTCKTKENYMEKLNDTPNMPELIGSFRQQVKPCFDVDAYNQDIDIHEIIAKINALFPNKKVNIAKREPREYKDKGIKYSYRFYVDGVRMTTKNLKKYLNDNGYTKDNKPFDLSIYDSNKMLLLPLTTKKFNDTVHPPLIPIDCEIFDCCASYIKEDFEDWDSKFAEVKPENKKIIKNVEDDDCSEFNEDDDNNLFNKLKNVIRRLSKARSEGYNDWIRVCWAIGNIGLKGEMRRGKIEELIHLFSKLSSNYNEDSVDEWIDKNLDNIKEQSYGWTYLYHTCVKEDDPKYYDNITKSYYLMKKEFEKTNAKILYPPMIVHKNKQGENVLQTFKSCKETNSHIKCKVKTTNKKEEVAYVEKKFTDLWLEDATIRRYDNYVFKPPNDKVEDYEYNTWVDFKIQQVPLIFDETVINRWLEYMRNLFNDENVVQYIIAYFANRLQNPANRNKVCIVLYGEEGDGKNRLYDIFKNIFGENYYTELESAKQMFGSHSCIEKEKLFICVNEAKGKDNYENSDILKARITTDTLMVNPKGIQEFKIDNYCDYIMTTNNANAVNIHDKSRRFLLVETTSYYSRNSEFFNKFSNDIVENPEALRVIYEYLINFDVKAVIPSGNFQNHIPETDIQRVIIQSNKDKILCFLEDLSSTCLIDDDEKEQDISREIKYSNNELFQKWIKWIERNRHDLKYNNISFHTRLSLLIKKKINVKGVIIRKDTHCNTYIDFVKLMDFLKQEK